MVKKIFFSAYLLIPLISVYGQKDSVLLRIDQLQGVEKASYVLEKMPYLFDHHVKEAIEYGREAYYQIDQIGKTTEEKYDFIFLLGSIYSTEGPQDSLDVLVNDLLEDSSDALGRGIAYLLRSYGLQSDNLVEAKKAALAAQETFQEISHKKYLARACYSAASISYEEGNYDEALIWVEKTLQILKSTELLRVEAVSYMLKGSLLREKGQGDSVRIYLYKALEIEEKAGNEKGIARVSNQLGIMEARLGNTSEAYDLFKKAMQIHEKLDNTYGYIQMINNLGIIHGMLGEYDSALNRYEKVLNISEQTGDQANKALALGNIGSTLITLSRYEESIKPLRNSLDLYKELGSKPGISRALNNLGNAYRNLKRYEDALPLLKEALVLKEEMGRKSVIGTNLHNIGDLYRQIEAFDSARFYYNRALALKKELGDKESIVNTYFGIGKLMRKMDESQLSHAYVDSALVLAKEVGLLFLIRDIHEFRAGYYAELEDFQSAYDSHVLFKTAYDSLFTTESESVVAELQEKFRTKEQQQQIELLEQKGRNQNLLLAGLAGGAFLLVILVAVIYSRYRLKNRSNKIIERKSEELERSNKELKELSEFKQGMTNMIAHDIKNPLNAIIGFSNMLEGKEGEEISKAGNAILQLVTNMLDVEKYETATPSLKLEPIILSELISEAKLAVELLLHDKSIELNTKIDAGVTLKVDRELMSRVLINLLSNAIKFSPHNDTVHVSSNVMEVEGKTYVKVSVSDNGLGVPKEDQPYVFEKFYQSQAKNSGRAPSTGLGLTFCKMAVSAHDGIISIESEQGSGCTFHLTLEVEKLSGVATKTEESVKGIAISESDLAILSKYSSRLKELKVHNVSAITAILDEIESLNLDTKWPAQIRSAVQYSNKEQFYSLLEMIY